MHDVSDVSDVSVCHPDPTEAPVISAALEEVVTNRGHEGVVPEFALLRSHPSNELIEHI